MPFIFSIITVTILHNDLHDMQGGCFSLPLSLEWPGEAVSIVSDREQLDDSGSGINEAFGVSGGMLVLFTTILYLVYA